MKRIKKIFIITGANGFLGNNIIRELSLNKEFEIRALILPNQNTDILKDFNCKIYYGDVREYDTLTEIFNINENQELVVIHCAAIVYIKSKHNQDVYDVNVNGTKNIVKKVLEKNAKLIYVSSVHAIPEKPNNKIMTEITNFDKNKVIGLYAKTKAEAANYVLNMVKYNNLNACIVHPSGIIRPFDYGNSHLTELIKEIKNGNLKTLVKGGYDFVDVRDVTSGILKCINRNISGECFILSNKKYEIKELADIICELKNIKKIKLIIPLWLVKLITPFYEMYYNLKRKTPLFTKYSLYTLNSNSNFSHDKAKQYLDYNPRNIRETLKDTIEWLDQNK